MTQSAHAPISEVSMTESTTNGDGDEACSIPLGDRHHLPGRQVTDRPHRRAAPKAPAPVRLDSTSVRSGRQVTAERRRINWWIVSGVIAVLLAAGVTVAGVISIQTRPASTYESVYIPQDSRQPAPR
ncbi:hypothetical protein K3M35_23895 [Rhodococcus sp. DMU2021]|uniref:hypothetical protein n=1 Tax=Rhodococcus sp. DMU2021 TaxID=2866997 RepID=UPI001C7D722D|nr:hypothetical protein [Rhodococcus sp. DMU2021]MBX4171651.1 hypothetical protein [Rhodococcus sp. DMU2021]